MAWLKRNLGMVIGGVVALVLLGLGGWYLYAKMQQDDEINGQLDTATASFKEILNRPVHPGNDKVNNIQLAKEENKRLVELQGKIRDRMVSTELPKDFSNKDFRAMLDTTVAELQHDAERYGIGLPQGGKDYWFTFATQKSAVEFKALETLTYELMDMKAICDVLYAAKVHDIIALKRVASTTDESGGDFLYDKSISTNDYTIVSPYQITFQGFSGELAKVMEGLINAKKCFIVKNIGVDKAPEIGKAYSPKQTAAPPPMMNPMMMNPMMARNPYAGMRMPMPMPQAPLPQQGPRKNVLLDENKLRFTLDVTSVRLKPLPQKKEKAAQPPGQPGQPPTSTQPLAADATAAKAVDAAPAK